MSGLKLLRGMVLTVLVAVSFVLAGCGGGDTGAAGAAGATGATGATGVAIVGAGNTTSSRFNGVPDVRLVICVKRPMRSLQHTSFSKCFHL